MDTKPKLTGINHINISMPKGAEKVADAFYVDVLGLRTRPKPQADAEGRWYEGAGFEVHLGPDPQFQPARRAHPAFVADNLAGLVELLHEQGSEVESQFIDGEIARAIVFDPFGNRIELLTGSSQG